MTSGDYFAGNSVVNWYINAENMLDDVLRIIPYCDEHKSVWSPKLVTILQETCSQLDSLWFYEAKKSPYVKEDRLDIKHYFEYFGEHIAPKWVVFWGEEPKQIQPFEPWAGLASAAYKKDKWNKSFALDWWEAYQKVKHNRLTNQRQATLRRVVEVLAALFLAILHCEDCRDAIAQTGWLSTAQRWDPFPMHAFLGEDSPSTKDEYIAAESKLFSYPVGWCTQNITKSDEWKGDASHRFTQWFNEYESKPETIKSS